MSTTSIPAGPSSAVGPAAAPARSQQAVPPLVLLAALEDVTNGVIIFDRDLRLWHVTEQAATVLGVQPGPALLPPEAYSLLSRSSLNAASVKTAQRYLEEFGESEETKAVVLHRHGDTGAVRMRLRNLGGGYRAAYFESVAGDDQMSLPMSGTKEGDLRRALALREFELFYQPQVNTATGELVAFEALIRWRHPERGLVSPAEFLPVAEETGAIVEIGEWVLRTACLDAMKWPKHIVLAVNAAPQQIELPGFAASVAQALTASGLPGERLEIEITEGALLRNDDVVMKTLADLRALNVRVAMDDFGTGHASLSQLAQFPFDKIKIDRSLAGAGGNDLKKHAIVRAIIALCRSLGLCTLAEGVECADQVSRLQMDGCGTVQGFFFGKPVPASELSRVISRLSVVQPHDPK